MHRKAIKGVLYNFLGTYTSRYSDYKGYWLFGMLVSKEKFLNIDLLNSNSDWSVSTPLAIAHQLAVQKFREQLEKTDLSISCVQEAHLDITRLPNLRNGTVNGHICVGYNMLFQVKVTSDFDRKYKGEMSIFVAPHDPRIELRSTRSN